ncbi:unnamed protein product [Notodromas monacha]|uniref:Uncharacterized protein n=1 Tax=Notodromas monacha TaxID=399045 RepID=A0A7R9BNJ4_9CRUS|nr:unnamed protein product [Notodromas monacha]CAG0917415.1 unnamed protein product [Notodromas monacha]
MKPQLCDPESWGIHARGYDSRVSSGAEAWSNRESETTTTTSSSSWGLSVSEDQNRGKPNWEHLQDDLHVLLTAEDTEDRAKLKLQRAVDEIKRLLVPSSFIHLFNSSPSCIRLLIRVVVVFVVVFVFFSTTLFVIIIIICNAFRKCPSFPSWSSSSLGTFVLNATGIPLRLDFRRRVSRNSFIHLFNSSPSCIRLLIRVVVVFVVFFSTTLFVIIIIICNAFRKCPSFPSWSSSSLGTFVLNATGIPLRLDFRRRVSQLSNERKKKGLSTRKSVTLNSGPEGSGSMDQRVTSEKKDVSVDLWSNKMVNSCYPHPSVPKSNVGHQLSQQQTDQPPQENKSRSLLHLAQRWTWFVTTENLADGEDELKKRQLMELAIINGTYRDSSMKNSAGELWCNHIAASLQASLKNCHQDDIYGGFFAGDLPRLMGPLAAAGLTSAVAAASQLRQQATPLGAPLILSPRLPPGVQPHTGLLNGSAGGNPLLQGGPGAHDTASLMFAPYSDAYAYTALAQPLFAEYNAAAAAAAAATADHTGGLFAR